MDIVSPATVLVIEDHDSVRVAISKFLKTGGFNVLEAASPDAAKTIWKQNRSAIELLLVDIGLQNTSGPDLVQELLKDGPTIPVIFATATPPPEARAATRNFENPIILQKPFSAEILVRAVRDALSQSHAFAGFTAHFKRPAKAAAVK